jgi:cellulose synthase/poly-beta-1,6-N-acetylglucosamine synthase-like glycosyltransferase
VFVSEPVSWTEAPEDRTVLRGQRRRWQRGLTEILARHRRMIGRPRYGVVGLVSLPWFVLFELAAPFVELVGVGYLALILGWYDAGRIGWVTTDLVGLDMAWLLLTASLLYSTVLTLSALLLEEFSYHRYRGVRDLLVAIGAALAENFGYRQLTAWWWWRVCGSVQAWRGRPLEWGEMPRRGLGSA